MNYTDDEKRRFWEKVAVAGPDECWEWQACKLKGYGLLQRRGKVGRAHRIAYELTNGPITDGLHCLHRCDNPSCVNPSHLFLGTHQQNMKDRNRKGGCGTTWGEDNPRSKLTFEQVENITTMLASGMTQAAIAKQFKVCPATISHVINGRNWKWRAA